MQVELRPNGIIGLAAGERTRQIDLHNDIVGCLGEVFDHSTHERFGVGEHRTVLDVTEDHGEHFVLLSAEAPANCSVQGECGGAPYDMTLIWLELGADLSLESKQVVVVEDCRNRGLEGERVEDGEWIEWRQHMLSLTHGTFTLGFTDETEVSRRVRYDRRAARSGLRIVR